MQASNILFFVSLVVAIMFVMAEGTAFLKSFILAFSIPSDIRLEYQAAVAGMEVIEARRVSKAQRRTFSERRFMAWMGYFENSIVFHAMVFNESERKFSVTPAMAVASVSAIGFALSPLFSVDALCMSFLGGAVTFASGSLKGYIAQKTETEVFNAKCVAVFKAAKA